MIRRFMFVTDTHWGWESKGGHKTTIHDPKALDVMLQFAEDFKPHDFIFGGDILDCGVISHHTKGKPRKTEGFRLLRDAEECRTNIIKPIERILPREGLKAFIIGNHCDWIEDLLDEEPGLEGLVDVKHLLELDKWKVIPQGGGIQYHKMYFIHGDTVKGGEHCAKKAVTDYARNIRFGHHHTYQAFTTTSPVDTEVARTGIAIPCLCSKDVGYMERIPNKWVQGWNYGWVEDNGVFNDQVAIVIRGKAIINGKRYSG